VSIDAVADAHGVSADCSAGVVLVEVCEFVEVIVGVGFGVGFGFGFGLGFGFGAA